MSFKISRLKYKDKLFYQKLDNVLALSGDNQDVLKIDQQVAEILMNVKMKGDNAVLDYTRKFDGITCSELNELEIGKELLLAALERIPTEQKEALLFAKERIEKYHHQQQIESW